MPDDLSIQRTRLSDLRTRVRFRGRGGTSPGQYEDDDDGDDRIGWDWEDWKDTLHMELQTSTRHPPKTMQTHTRQPGSTKTIAIMADKDGKSSIKYQSLAH